MKGYKAFNKDWTCRDFQYEIGKSYELPEGKEPIMCRRGFHFCENPIDVFGYYPISDETVIAEVEAYGEILREGTKLCTNKIRIIREFTREELKTLIRDGNYNSGDYNSGNYNSGNYNSGDFNSGNYNSGDFNSGFYNSGNFNSSNYNSGDFNSGYYNSGNFNSGDFNSGYYNSGNFNSGIFNTNEPFMRAFNNPTQITFSEFFSGLPYSLSGLLTAISRKELDETDWEYIRELPNYDAALFERITGIKDPNNVYLIQD